MLLTLMIVGVGGDGVGVGALSSFVISSISTSCGFFVGDVMAVKRMGLIDVLLQRAHRHSPNSPRRTPFNDGITIDRYSEKNLSPLSSGRTLAYGKGRRQPTAVATLFVFHSSV